MRIFQAVSALCLTALFVIGCSKEHPQKGAALPLPPSAESLRILAPWLDLTNEVAVAAAFSPGEKTKAPDFLQKGAVKLTAEFTQPRPPARANWDVKMPCDLRAERGLQFDFYCSDMSQFTGFSLYFKSGKGWYHGTFSPEENGKWQRVEVTRGNCKPDGAVEGWGKISHLRISGWRAGTNTAICAIANLATIGGTPDVAIVYADSVAAREKANGDSYVKFATTIQSSLLSLGLEGTLIADTDLHAELITTAKAIVLPYNPAFPVEKLPILQDYLAAGGRLLVCYSLPKEIAGLIGVKPTGTFDRLNGKIAGLLKKGNGLAGQPAFSPQASWVTHVVRGTEPGVEVVAEWADGAHRSLGVPALLRTPRGVYLSHVWLGGTEEAPLALMRSIMRELAPALDEKMEASARARLDRQVEQRRWLKTRPSKKGEHRAFWCHSPHGLGGGRSWDESIKFLRDNGFNAILANLAWGGTAFYDSKVLPVHRSVKTQGDALVQCLAACRKYGVKCHVWKVCWNTGHNVEPSFVAKMKAEGRLQEGFKANDGEKRAWLCPSHPDNQQLEIEAMVELAKKGVDGIHFDYIRYPGSDRCFCSGCKERFETAFNVTVTNWPAQVRTDERLEKRWKAFRASNITKVVQTVSERVRKEAPGVQISAAVFRNHLSDPSSVGQDWALWCREGYLDFICNMDYIDSAALFRSQIDLQHRVIDPKVKFYPGIGLSCWPHDGRQAERLALQIQATRDAGLEGFTVFNYDRLAEKVLPLMRLGVTKED